jgi:hypothetical protein
MKGMGPGGRKLDATNQGTEVGTVDQGADPSATSDTTSTHIDRESYHLGVEIHSAEACKFGSTVHGAEIGVHFLKSFQTRHICEKFSPKGPTSKKVSLNSSMATTHVIENNVANTPYFYCSYSILS